MTSAGSRLFDRWSAVYDGPRFQDATYPPVHDAVSARLLDRSPRTVLDLGCGTGQLTRRLMQEFPDAEVLGLDYSSGMLSAARRRVASNADLVHADAQCLPFELASVDVAVCTEPFHWYRDQRRAVAALAEVLRPGGQLVIASVAAVVESGESTVRG